MNDHKAEAIGKIALDMPDGPPTTEALLRALIAAYNAGFKRGQERATESIARLGDAPTLPAERRHGC